MGLTYEQVLNLSQAIMDEFKEKYGFELNDGMLKDIISDGATATVSDDPSLRDSDVRRLCSLFTVKANLLATTLAKQITRKAAEMANGTRDEREISADTYNGLEQVFEMIWNAAYRPQLDTKAPTPAITDLVTMHSLESCMNFTRLDEIIEERKTAGTYHVADILAETNDLMDRFDNAMGNHQNNGRGGYDVHLSAVIASMDGDTSPLLNAPLNDEKIGSNSIRNVVAAFVVPYKLLETKYNNRNFFSRIFRFGERAALNRVLQTMKSFIGGDLSDERAKKLLDDMAKEMPSNRTRPIVEAVHNHEEPNSVSIVQQILNPANNLTPDERLEVNIERDRIIAEADRYIEQSLNRDNIEIDISENSIDVQLNDSVQNYEPVAENSGPENSKK